MPPNDPAQRQDKAATEAFDLTNCENEPIHLLGRVQPFGALLAFNDDWRITRASANLEDFWGIRAKDAIGRMLTDICEDHTLHDIRTQAQLLGSAHGVNRVFGHELRSGRPKLDFALHRAGDQYVLEVEYTDQSANPADFARVQGLVSRLKGRSSMADLTAEAAKCLRALTGFDRVMVYRFNEDLSGNVIAEAKRPGQTPYLGLRYPASDIPKQARELYLRSPIRIIADSHDTGVPILPEKDAKGTPLDLSLSMGRSVSPIHLEYLRNMGVGASMSVSIIRNGKLWGLFACHHETPYYVNFRTRTAVELFAQLATYELAEFEMAEDQAQLIEAQKLHTRLTTLAADGKLVTRFPDLAEEMRKVISFDGIAIRIGDTYLSEGAAPTREEFLDLGRFLDTAAASNVFVSNAVSDTYPEIANIESNVAGMLALPISRAPRDYLVLFRREVVRSVQWAGDPKKPVRMDGASRQPTPRRSFAEWKERVQGQSTPWSEHEVRTAEAVRVILLEIILKMADAEVAFNQRLLAEKEIVVAELNHRVRNILALVRSLLNQSESERDGNAFITLASRIQAFARAHDQLAGEARGNTSLSGLIAVETEALAGSSSNRVMITGPDVDISADAYTSFALVIHELVTNSAKYGALSVPNGRLSIETEWRPDGRFGLRWRELDGPEVTLPKRGGFGMTIIERTIPYQMDGTVEVHFEPEGLKVDFEMPGTELTPVESNDASGPKAVSTEPQRVHGTILLVEDNVIISLDASETLLAAGAKQIETAASVSSALALIEQRRFDAAVLDVNLGSTDSRDVAKTLAALNIPYCVVTGYNASDVSLTDFPDAEIITKPYSRDTLCAAVARLLSKC